MPKLDGRGRFWKQIEEAARELSPEVILQEADRPITVALVAEDSRRLKEIEEFFAPSSLGPRKAEQVRERTCSFVLPLGRTELEGLRQLDLVVCSSGAAKEMRVLVPGVYVYSAENPSLVVKKILKEHWELALPLARNFLPFRRAVGRRSVRSIALENALFAITSEVSGFVPAPFSLLRRSGRLGSSTLFLTANQMRLAFLLAAAHDSEVGFREQTGQLTAIAAAALGWRALARGLGARRAPVHGILASGLLAFGATYATGFALERLNSLGSSMTREEKAAALHDAYRLGRTLLDGVLDAISLSSRRGWKNRPA